MKIDNNNLEDYIMTRLLEVQSVIYEKRNNNISIEELSKFINSAMNYGEFQIWLLENNMQGIKLTSNEILKKFLSETSDDEILKLYDAEQNYGENNTESIRTTSKKNSQNNNDSSRVKSNIIQENSKIISKKLLK